MLEESKGRDERIACEVNTAANTQIIVKRKEKKWQTPLYPNTLPLNFAGTAPDEKLTKSSMRKCKQRNQASLTDC